MNLEELDDEIRGVKDLLESLLEELSKVYEERKEENDELRRT